MAECNVENRTIFCDDNLDVLQGINSECIDLIYLDPPFNKNKTFTAPIGTSAEGASFKDIFREDDLKEEWLSTIEEDHSELYQYLNGIKGIGKSYNFAYLAYMAIRLLECQRILKPTGAIYLHCDPTMSHYLKTTLDCIFGENNFKNEIIWLRKQGEQHNLARKRLPSSHDVIFWYGSSSRTMYNIHLIQTNILKVITVTVILKAGILLFHAQMMLEATESIHSEGFIGHGDFQLNECKSCMTMTCWFKPNQNLPFGTKNTWMKMPVLK